MARMTITEAAKAWNVHHDTVRQWVRRGSIEAAKDNTGTWRIVEGQQPPPSAARSVQPPEGSTPGDPRVIHETPQATDLGLSQDGLGSTLGEHLRESRQAVLEIGNQLMTARQDAAVTRREVELLREAQVEERKRHQERVDALNAALAAAQGEARERAREAREAAAAGEAERARLQELLRQALDRPTWLERALRALRGSGPKGPV
jgi:excisionase family DNA binding protein